MYQLCKNLSVGRHQLEYQWHKILVLAGSINDISHGKTLAGAQSNWKAAHDYPGHP